MRALGLILSVASILLISACVPNGTKRQGHADDHTQHSIATKRTWPEIQHTFNTMGPEFEKIYNARLRQRPDLTVKLKLALTIEPNGKVQNVHILQTTTHDTILESKLIDIVSHMDFGPVRSQNKLTLTYPIAFIPK